MVQQCNNNDIFPNEGVLVSSKRKTRYGFKVLMVTLTRSERKRDRMFLSVIDNPESDVIMLIMSVISVKLRLSNHVYI